jgi:hypothetical protein
MLRLQMEPEYRFRSAQQINDGMYEPNGNDEP